MISSASVFDDHFFKYLNTYFCVHPMLKIKVIEKWMRQSHAVTILCEEKKSRAAEKSQNSIVGQGVHSR